MIIAYCFIGQLPAYSVDTVHQARLFFDGDIYFIVSDYESKYVSILKNRYNVNIIKYEDVICNIFNEVTNKLIHKFCIAHNLPGREKLFIYSFERFFVLYNLMKKHSISDVLFLELDNLIYDNPNNWEYIFEKKLAYMFDANKRYSSGICFIKDIDILEKVNNCFIDFIIKSNEFINEMSALSDVYDSYKEDIHILPTLWDNNNNNDVPDIVYNNYNNSIFDPSAIGIYLCGVELAHSGGVLKKGIKWDGCLTDYTIYQYKWEEDELNRKIPYIYNKNDNKWIRINNLHIHSKILSDNLSKSIEY